MSTMNKFHSFNFRLLDKTSHVQILECRDEWMSLPAPILQVGDLERWPPPAAAR